MGSQGNYRRTITLPCGHHMTICLDIRDTQGQGVTSCLLDSTLSVTRFQGDKEWIRFGFWHLLSSIDSTACSIIDILFRYERICKSGSAGGLTSLEASLVRCFTFSETSPKTSRGDVFFKTSLEHRTVKQKVRCFSFQKAHSETKPTPPSLLLQHQQKEPSIWTGSSSLLRGL